MWWLFFTKAMMFVHMFVGVILVGIILLQRGRGGGLAGAFGGMGGQSAFGTKAGDVFTKITIYIASIWIVLGCVCVIMASNFKATKASRYKGGAAAGVQVAPAEDEKNPAANEKAGENVPPGPANPPATKTEPMTETKGDGDLPVDPGKTEAKPADAEKPNVPAVKEGESAESKGATDKPKDATNTPADPTEKPKEPTEKPAEPTEKKPD